ncbi:MAG: ferritin-like domain-containing protein [Pseudomonadota bacterium]
MNNIFEYASRCLHDSLVEEKLAATRDAWMAYEQGRLTFEPEEPPQPIEKTRFPQHPVLVAPKRLPKRSLSTSEGLIAFLHSIAHIEFTAIYLAWDILYRFRGLPPPFYADWLGVAHEEALHFSMIRGRLRELGSDYGMLPAHRGLWEVAEDTAHDLLARLALVPRYMEARGLDVTPSMIDKLDRAGDKQSAALLTRILDDEVGHVGTGSRWFGYVCEHRGLEPERAYFDLLKRHLRGRVRGPFNHALRESAGFTRSELLKLENMGSEQ